MKHCGNEKCKGTACANFQMCRGETVPPWTLFQFAPPTSKVSIREQDVLAAADELADAVSEWISKGLVQLPLPLDEKIKQYRKERNGTR